MHYQQIAFVPQQRKQGRLAGNVVFHLQQRGRSFRGDLMLLGRAQLAPFRPAKTEHLVQYAGTLNRKWNRMQVTALDFHLSLRGGCHLSSAFFPFGYCDCKPAALDFVSMPAAKTSGAKSKSGLKPPAKAAFAVKPKAVKPKAAKGSYDPVAPERVKDILNRLDARYPNVRCALHHNNAWELLIATILSAQCTDVMVNKVTPGLFQKYPTPQAMAATPEQL